MCLPTRAAKNAHDVKVAPAASTHRTQPPPAPTQSAADMISTEQILQHAAQDGSIDSNEWPRVLESVLTRLDEIVHNYFPKPSIPAPEPPPSQSIGSTPNRPQEASLSSQESQSADKENAPPPATPPARPPVPPFSQASSTQVDGASPEAASFPAETLNFYASIRATLSKNFPCNPPHTIQRLAELVLSPTAHYKHLPPYLRALDRVVSVSSPTIIFPLPQAILPSSVASGLLNGTVPATSNSLGSDESLGGALLTPIPWLRSDRNPSQSELVSESTEMVDGPRGAGRIETVSVVNGITTPPASPSLSNSTLAEAVNGSAATPTTMSDSSLREAGAITQGELLRQEQEAGVVPLSQNGPHARRNIHSTGDSGSHGAIVESVEAEDEPPHARGPEEIGIEDMGPQNSRTEGRVLDIEAAVGRPAVKPEEQGGKGMDEEMKDAGTKGEQMEEDTVVVDADGKTEEETKVGEGDGEMSDTIDMSTR
ncbi:hypothetical protein K432DRAFT_358790 [Lepidopterella palustris CBS 459.81]|uniref:Protein phosphatase 4 core regulatory subunit R2 n=1 Tax=Lepidopterella palustris CBS 459.81 TaxID=1314670 RepID=A0A8E2E512_9PEZI|nr:hypothetical protein K432DRAFT_358790 [Lepidopterella palustris CBS 459.81]